MPFICSKGHTHSQQVLADNCKVCKANEKRRNPSLEEIEASYARKLSTKKKVSVQGLRRTREAIIKKRFDMGM